MKFSLVNSQFYLNAKLKITNFYNYKQLVKALYIFTSTVLLWFLFNNSGSMRAIIGLGTQQSM